MKTTAGNDDLILLLESNALPKPGQTVNQFLQDILDSVGKTGYRFQASKAGFEELKARVVDYWAEHFLYEGEQVPANVAQALLESGLFDKSHWLEELREFARA